MRYKDVFEENGVFYAKDFITGIVVSDRTRIGVLLKLKEVMNEFYDIMNGNEFGFLESDQEEEI